MYYPRSPFGTHADMDAICQIATRHNLYIIEDAAPLVCNIPSGRWAEILVWNDTYRHHQFFSFKNLGCFGDGGASITKNEELAEKTE